MTHKSPNNQAVAAYHPITRWLHASLVVGVLLQLSFAIWMTHPDHHKDSISIHNELAAHQEDIHAASELSCQECFDKLPKTLMQAHRNIGLLLVMIVLLNVIWAAVRRGQTCKRQCAVLYSKQHWRSAFNIAKDVPMMMLGKRPLAEPGNALSLIIEMLGLLTMAGMAVTGLVIWILWAGLGSEVSAYAKLFMQLHGSIATILLIYLSGHISMAWLHWRSGDMVFSRISPFEKSPK